MNKTKEHHNPSHEEKLETLRDIIRRVDICMLTTTDSGGQLRSRPLSNNKDVEFDGDLWFFISSDSAKVGEINRDDRVNASFADIDGRRYASLSGRAELVTDKAVIARLWKPEYKLWFQQGIETPGLALLKVAATQAEYWDASQPWITHAVNLLASMLSGQEPDLGENEKLRL